MKSSELKKSLTVAFLALFGSASCHDYAVTDLRSGTTYYTNGNLWLMRGRSGGLSFNETTTGDYITLQNARAHELSPAEAKAVISAPQHTPPTATKENGS